MQQGRLIEWPLSARGDEPARCPDRQTLFAKLASTVSMHVKVPCVSRMLRTIRCQPAGTRTQLQAWLRLMVRGDLVHRVTS